MEILGILHCVLELFRKIFEGFSRLVVFFAPVNEILSARFRTNEDGVTRRFKPNHVDVFGPKGTVAEIYDFHGMSIPPRLVIVEIKKTKNPATQMAVLSFD